MGSVTPLKTDCAVSGTFHFILYLSRLAGTSPVKFEKVNVTLTSIYSLDRDKVVDGYESSNNTGFMRIALIIHLLVHYAVGGAITATGLNRMRHMIDCTARLQEIYMGEVKRDTELGIQKVVTDSNRLAGVACVSYCKGLHRFTNALKKAYASVV
ncbi:unnamed protein product [Arctia plantaginis]|uniref:Uncharacterized protein n=1 Tax=Arctia plantaginis TaxID=874455 RepID=A0A8S0Z1J8_ARCPL|nr:unnamed protein product [Arctia plantaginis]